MRFRAISKNIFKLFFVSEADAASEKWLEATRVAGRPFQSKYMRSTASC
jgi:hypothetical protein